MWPRHAPILGLLLSSVRTRSASAHHNSRAWEVGEGRMGVQIHPWLYSELEASLGYIRCFLKSILGYIVSLRPALNPTPPTIIPITPAIKPLTRPATESMQLNRGRVDVLGTEAFGGSEPNGKCWGSEYLTHIGYGRSGPGNEFRVS